MVFEYYTYTAGPVAQKVFQCHCHLFQNPNLCRLPTDLHHARAGHDHLYFHAQT